MATIIDVAKLANVSKSTVSRYLNNQDAGRMSQETKDRIKEAIKELNYSPNNIARGLKGKPTKVIGLLMNDLTNPFFLQVVKGVEEELRDSEYNILMCDANLDLDKEADSLRMLMQRKVDGIIIVGAQLPVEHIKELDINVPIVLFERDGRGEYDCIMIDNYTGAYNGVQSIIDKGYSNIGHIAGTSSSTMAIERKNAFVQCLLDNNLDVIDDYIIDGMYKLEGGYDAMKKLLQLPTPPDAVFCANDMSAIGALRYIVENGLNVPDDIALLGYDDVMVASLVTPPLTTVKQPVLELSKKGTEILLNKIKFRSKDKNRVESIVLKPELIFRKSL